MAAINFQTAGATLTIDLGAIQNNWSALAKRVAPAACAGIVKADAYGLGLGEVGPALAAAGCRLFFVAHADEGVRLRRALAATSEAEIYVLNGVPAGAEAVFHEHALIPVLNSLSDIDRWRDGNRDRLPVPAAIQIDTGMSRLGLPADEVARLQAAPDRLDGIDLRYWLSHLACADSPDDPMTDQQRRRLITILDRLPKAPVSLANSPGIFHGPGLYFDLVRPGIAVYGGNPTPGRPNPMAQTVHVQTRILQLRTIDRQTPVGYGAAHKVTRKARIATIPVGYGDGYLRALSDRGYAHIGSHRVPVVGRVSMDLITLDVTDVPPPQSQPGAVVDVIGGPVDIDALADAAGTIAYELLTNLGHRYHRIYKNRG